MLANLQYSLRFTSLFNAVTFAGLTNKQPKRNGKQGELDLKFIFVIIRERMSELQRTLITWAKSLENKGIGPVYVLFIE